MSDPQSLDSLLNWGSATVATDRGDLAASAGTGFGPVTETGTNPGSPEAQITPVNAASDSENGGEGDGEPGWVDPQPAPGDPAWEDSDRTAPGDETAQDSGPDGDSGTPGDPSDPADDGEIPDTAGPADGQGDDVEDGKVDGPQDGDQNNDGRPGDGDPGGNQPGDPGNPGDTGNPGDPGSPGNPGDGTKPPDDSTKPPDDGTKPPEDGTKPPEDGTKPPEDGTKPPEDGTKPPDDGTKPPEDGTKPPGTEPPGTETPKIPDVPSPPSGGGGSPSGGGGGGPSLPGPGTGTGPGTKPEGKDDPPPRTPDINTRTVRFSSIRDLSTYMDKEALPKLNSTHESANGNHASMFIFGAAAAPVGSAHEGFRSDAVNYLAQRITRLQKWTKKLQDSAKNWEAAEDANKKGTP
ncbi:hypothetical protein [Nonomuraea typhae]|uniref:hypothetical protein n=1 Tax=Nonomuraea typhae TaxID=2603600 RepID=UPI0012FBA334|nr:hypothetical protein [Nonomuraea typhae]